MLDNRSLEAFEAAARHLNFTRAARTAAMTQSGISQHIARIEKELGVPLFQRVNRRVFLTSAGKILKDHLEHERESEQRLRDAIHGEVGRVTGTVRYAMPYSCLFTPHLDQLLSRRQGFAEVKIEINLCPNEEIFAQLLKQEIDFGFVTKRIANPALEFEEFCQEEYLLVGARKESFENLPYCPFVYYPGMDTLYRLWADRYLSKKDRLCPTALEYGGRINSITGAILMAEKGVWDPLESTCRHASLSIL